MFEWIKKKLATSTPKAKVPRKPAPMPGLKGSLLSLESRLMFDAAAAATAAEVNQEQVAQEQAEAAVLGDSTGETQGNTDSQELLQVFTTYLPAEPRQEIVFVDPTVPNYQDLLRGMDSSIEVILLDGGQDGIQQMADALAGRTGIDAIHLISHGNAGTLQLGTGTLTTESMSGQYVDELAAIQRALSEQADILVYGCDFAEGEVGQAAVNQLAALTGADVQASTDLTGNVALGGDWQLEVQTGTIETQVVITDETQMDWIGILAETWMDAATGNVIAGPAGNDWYVGDSSNNTPTAAGGGTDFMYGAGGDDTLQGGSGNDILVGGTGNDTIYGNSDDDVILGGTGNDYLDGGSAVGKNTIIGGGGNDQMVGGSGADVFRFTGAQSGDAYTVDGGGATDIIDLSEFSTATITNSGGIITVDRGGGNVFTITHSNVETIITAATVGNHGPLADAGVDQTVSLSSTVTLTAAGSSDQDGNTLTYQWTQIEGPKVTLSSSTAASPTFTAPSSATTLQFIVVVSDGTTSHADTVTINVGAANVAPTISNLSGDSLSYSEGDGAVVIDQGADALVADSDSANFDTGTLTVSFTAGSDSAEDVLSIRNQGTSAGQIGVSGSNITYGGTTIGTFTGGSSGSNLVITLNSNATPTAVTALVKNITYQNTDTDAPTTGARTVRYVLTDGDGGTSANYDTTVTVSSVNDAPLNSVPGAQATNEDTSLVFSSGNGNQIAISDPDASGGTFEATISVTNGTLTLAGTTGLTFVAGDGTADATMTVRGTVTSINSALNGASFTPTSDYNGSATLTITSLDNTLVSLNIDANLQARYTFEGSANDVASGTAQNGTLVNGATYVTDGTRGQVLSLDGVNDYVQISGTFSNPSEVTIGGWVNLAAGTGRKEFISLDDRVLIALDYDFGVTASVQTGASSWVDLTSGQFIAGTGWHHVMYSYSDSTNTHSLYIDGVQVATATVNSSIYWTGATDTYIGQHPVGTNYANAMIDDVRIYNRVLTATEVANLSQDLTLTDTDSVAITVSAVNDGPVLADTALTLTVAEDAGAPSGAVGSAISAFTGGITDVDSGASKGIAITGTDESNGTWYYTTNGGTTWMAVGTVSNTSALLLADNGNTRLYFAPNADYAGTSTAALTVRAWDQTNGTVSSKVDTSTNGGTTAFSSGTDTVDVTVTAVNDAPTDLSSGIELNTDGGSDAYLISDTGLSQSLTATTVEIRFAANDLPLETVLLSFNNPAGDEFSIQLDDPSNNLEIDFGGGTVAFASAIDYRAALVDGAVHTLSVTWDSTAGNWSVYIDGSFIESETGLNVGTALDTTNGQFVFGQEQDGQNSGYDSTQYFSGTFYDVRIWNDVRTAGEIAQYDQQQLDVTPAEAATIGLVANWQMDGFDGSSQVVDIVSGNNLSIAHATGTGFTTAAVDSQLSIEENSANGSHVGFVMTADSDAGETFSYSLTDSAGGRFAVNSATGEITVANGTLLDYESTTSHNITVRVTDSGGLTYDEVLTIQVKDVEEAPVNIVPAAQSINEDTTLAFNAANSNLISINDDTGEILVVTVAVDNGTVTLSGTVGLTFTTGDGTADATMTFSGTVEDINAALDGLQYDPTADYSGSDTLTITNYDQTLYSLNLDANLQAHYTFEGNATDVAPGTAQDGTLTNGASITTDGTRGDVLSLDGVDDFVDLSAHTADFAGLTQGTISGWIKATGTFETIFSISDTADMGSYASLFLGASGYLTYEVMENGVMQLAVYKSDVAINDGNWHHVAVTIGPSGNSLYVDGVLATAGQLTYDTGNASTQSFFSSVSGLDSMAIGRNQDSSGGKWYTTGNLDDVRLYDRVLTTSEVANLADDLTLVDTDTVAITVNPVNDAPTITNLSGDSLAYNEGDGAVVIEQGGNALVADVDSSNFDTGTLTVSFTAGSDAAEDVLSIRNQGTGAGQIGVSGANITYGGTVIGAFTGGSGGSNLVITFNSNATPTAVTALVSNITYENTDTAAPTTGARTVRYVLTDSDGGTSVNYDTTVTVGGANDAPVLTFGEGDKTFTEGALAVMIDALPTVSDLDSTNFDTGTLTITISANPSVDDRVELLNTGMGSGQIGVSGTDVYYGGTLIGTQAGGIGAVPFVITFNANADSAIVGEVMANIRFWVAGDTPSTATRTVEAVLTDGDGGTSLTASKQITVTAVNDAPVLDLDADNSSGASGADYQAAFAEGGGPVSLVDGTDALLSDVDSGSLTGLTVTLSNQLDGVSEVLSADTTGTAIVAVYDSGTSVLTLSGIDTVAHYQQVLRTIQYNNTSTSPDLTSRILYIVAEDGVTYSNTGTVTVTMTATNDAPTDLTLSANTVTENAMNGTVVGTVTGTDPDTGDTQTYSLTDSAGGRFAINNSTGQITVANSALLNYEAAISHTVTVRVTDSGGLTYDETFTINLTDVNEAPTGADATITINEDTAHALTTANFGFSDVDAGDSLSAVRIDSLLGAGSLTLSGVAVTAGQVILVSDITAGNLVFTPAADANGTGYASFTFSVRDSTNAYDTVPNTLTFDVTPTTDAPVNTVPGAQIVAEDTPLPISGISVNDVDGNLSTVQLAVGNGAVSVTLSGSATISAGANGTGTLTLSGSQVDINATLATLVYQGGSNYTGADTLTVTSTDANSGSDVDTVTITVTAVDDPTIITGGTSGSGNEDTTITGTLTATDAEGLSDGTVFTVSTNATNGTASIDPATGLWSYTPNADFNGSDSFTVTITDDAGNTSTQVISVTVTPVVDIINDSLTTSEDTAISANVLTGTNGATADSFEGTPVLTGVTQGANGSVTFLANGTVSYTPNANFTGTDSFTYTITSGGVTETATVTVTVTAVDDPTVVTGGTSGSGNEDTTLTGTLTATDADGLIDGTVFTVSANATNGTASIDPATGLWSYTPNADFNGSDSFTVTITDDAGNTSMQVVNVTVTPVNDAPLVVTNTGSVVAEGGTDTIDASELAVTDIEQAAAQLTYTIGTGPAYGRLELATAPGITATTFTQADIVANRLIYIHDGSELASDSFTFTVNDGAGGSTGTTTVTLTITPVNDAPTITSDGGVSTASISVAENVSVVTIVTGADVDLPAQALTYGISGGVDQARFTINAATGALNFTAPPDFEVATDANGDNVYVVQVQVTDSQGASTTQTIQVTVTDVLESAPPPQPPDPAVPPVLVSPLPLPGGATPGPGTPPPVAPVTPVDTQAGSRPAPSGSTVPPSDVRPINQAPLTLVPSPDRPAAKQLEEPKRLIDDITKETPLFLVTDEQGRPLFTVLPVEPTPTLEPDPPERTPSVSDLLMTKLDEMTVSLEQAVTVSEARHELMARVAAVTGTTLSVGFVAWALRSGAILASCLATMPAWRHFDPLPVVKLTRSERKLRRDTAAQAQQQEAAEFKGLTRVLDAKPSLKRSA